MNKAADNPKDLFGMQERKSPMMNKYAELNQQLFADAPALSFAEMQAKFQQDRVSHEVKMKERSRENLAKKQEYYTKEAAATNRSTATAA